MLERSEPILKGACVVLGLLLAAQGMRMVLQGHPLRRVEMPQVPTWSPRAAEPAATPGATLPAMPMPPGVPGGAGVVMGGPSGGLPPDVQAKTTHILQSGLLGPVIRPPPTALLGVAGDAVFLRGPNGEMGLVRTGESLGGVKILKVGTNRVLVQEDGQEKELTIFGGLGGESLRSPRKEDSP